MNAAGNGLMASAEDLSITLLLSLDQELKAHLNQDLKVVARSQANNSSSKSLSI